MKCSAQFFWQVNRQILENFFSLNKTPPITTLKNHWSLILLHWGTVMAILVGVGSIIIREYVEEYSYQTGLLELHRQMGVLVLLFVAIRLQVNYLIDRSKHKHLPVVLRLGGGICHTILYSLMITLPLLGIGLTNAHNIKVSFLGLGKLPSLVPANSELANMLTNYHSFESWVLLGMVVLHISSALVHHYVFKDKVLSAMLFRKKIEIMFL
jgi:cytochrome b561